MLKNTTGFSFLELLIALSLSTFALTSLPSVALQISLAKKTSLKKQRLVEIQKNIANALNNKKSLRETIHALPNTTFSCIQNNSNCSGVSGLFSLKLSDGSSYTDSTVGSGFNLFGHPCVGFDTAGNDNCPIRVELKWSPDCQGLGCKGGSLKVLKIDVSFQYAGKTGLAIRSGEFDFTTYQEISQLPPPVPAPFVTTWNIANAGDQVELFLKAGFIYNAQVDWGDGSPTDAITSSIDPDKTHAYASPGIYTVTIAGTMEAWGAFGVPFGVPLAVRNRLLTVENLGDLGWKSFNGGFSDCVNLTTVKGNLTSSVTNIRRMFEGARKANPNTTNWDTSSVINMSSMFEGADKAIPDTTNWDTSSVTNMSLMFNGADKANPDISKWDTSSVIDMSGMFRLSINATPDTSNLDTSSVETMAYMFSWAQKAIPNTTNWDTSSVTSMANMFSQNPIANPDTTNWDTSSVTTMNGMFFSALSANPNTANWNTSSVVYMGALFRHAISANPNTTNWDTSSVVNMGSMFNQNPIANPDTTNWDVSSVQRMRFMFWRANIANPNTTNWNTSSVEDMSYMFNEAPLANPDTTNWDTSSVTTMRSMFAVAPLATPNTTNWNTSLVTDMSGMFSGATSANPNTSLWITPKLKNTGFMFSSATSANPDMNSWNFQNIEIMKNMFNGATAFTNANYENLLKRIDATTLKINITLDAPLNKASDPPAVAARNNLILNGWVITDIPP